MSWWFAAKVALFTSIRWSKSIYTGWNNFQIKTFFPFQLASDKRYGYIIFFASETECWKDL